MTRPEWMTDQIFEFDTSDDSILAEIQSMVGGPDADVPTVTMQDIERFRQTLGAFGVFCAETAEAFRMPDGPEIVDDQPEWYEDANPWDAHTVTYENTLERIDQTLNLHQDHTPIDVDEILSSLGPEFDDIPDSPYGSAYTPEQWPDVLAEIAYHRATHP